MFVSQDNYPFLASLASLLYTNSLPLHPMLVKQFVWVRGS